MGPNDDPLIWLDNSMPLPPIVVRGGIDTPEFLHHRFIGDFNLSLSHSKLARSKIVHFRDGNFTEVVLERMDGLSYPVQPLGDDHYLVGGCPRGKGSNEFNSVVVDKNGVILQRLNLGSGLEAMQTTRTGNIWAYYFEQTVFSTDPISQKVIACFDSDGKHKFPDVYNDVFEYWCTGMNVESDESVWFAPSSGNLVQVENFSVKTNTANRCSGEIFAIGKTHVFWAPSEFNSMNVDFFVAANLSTGVVKFFQAFDEDGNRLDHHRYAARGSRMFFMVNNDVYVIDMQSIQF